MLFNPIEPEYLAKQLSRRQQQVLKLISQISQIRLVIKRQLILKQTCQCVRVNTLPSTSNRQGKRKMLHNVNKLGQLHLGDRRKEKDLGFILGDVFSS